MRLFTRSAATFHRINWRSKQNLLRLTLLLAVLGIIVAASLLHSRITLTHLGYTGVGLSALLASGGIFVPSPALAAACTASLFLVPVFVGLIAGTAETFGELTGYFLGYSGRGIVQRRSLYQKLEKWMQHRGWLLLFVLSVVPNPVFDVAGITAGAMRYPLWSFLGVVAAGKLIKFMAIAYACALSVEWLSKIILWIDSLRIW